MKRGVMRRAGWMFAALVLVHVASPGVVWASSPTGFAPQDTSARKKGDRQARDTTKAKQRKAPIERTPAEDSARRAKRAEKANTLPLFAERAPLAFTLTANFGRIARDRDTLSQTRYDGTLAVLDESGKEARVPVKIRTRGHFRLMQRNCRFVPLRIEFPDSGLKGTPFRGEKALKLGTHCQSDERYEQYTLKEYLAYRIYNTITERSFRARLATATYVDSASSKRIDTRVALWVENEDDVADRLGGNVRDLRRALFDDVDPETVDLLSLFELAIGNTDFSLYALHNVRMVTHPTGVFFPIPYDFDFSGLVNATYARPDPKLPITGVRSRLYRGPCRSLEVIQSRLSRIVEKRKTIMGLFAEVPGLPPNEVGDARAYLDEFFRLAENPRDVQSMIVEGCPKKPGV